MQVTKSTDNARFFEGNQLVGVSYGMTELAVEVVANETTHVYPRLVEGCVNAISSSTVGPTRFGVAGGLCSGAPRAGALASVTFDPSRLGYVDAGPYVGTFHLELIPSVIERGLVGAGVLPAGSWFLGMPGDLSAQRSGGLQTEIQELGAVEIRLLDEASGAPLVLLPGNGAVVQFDTTREGGSGEVVGLFAFDPPSGQWLEFDGGLAFADAGTTIATATVGQFGAPLLVGAPLGPTSCVQGSVTVGGAVVPGVTVMAYGTDHAAAYSARADDQGNFCLDVRAQSAIELDVVAALGGAPYHGIAPATSGTGSACSLGLGCTNVGTLDLTLEDTVCATGRLFGPGSMPNPDGGAPVPAPDNAPEPFYADVPVDAEDQSVGRYPRIYRGNLQPNSDATFCVAALGWPTYQYTVGYDPGYLLYLGIDGGEPASACSTAPALCQPLGDLDYFLGS